MRCPPSVFSLIGGGEGLSRADVHGFLRIKGFFALQTPHVASSPLVLCRRMLPCRLNNTPLHCPLLGTSPSPLHVGTSSRGISFGKKSEPEQDRRSVGSRGPSSETTKAVVYDPAFIEDLQKHISSFPLNEWVLLSDLYAKISSEHRRMYVRPHRTLLATLNDIRRTVELDITIDNEGVYWCRGTPANNLPHAGAAATEWEWKGTSPRQKIAVQVVCSDNGIGGKTFVPSFKEPAPDPGASVKGGNVFPPVDFYFDVGLLDIPPPPVNVNAVASVNIEREVRATEDGSVITLKSFVAHIPPFFAPLNDVLKEMPGYTEEHIQSYFQSAAVEMVNVSGERFIRLFGGFGKISLEGCEQSEERFRRYKPSLPLAQEFVKVFEGITDKWMPLKVLLSRAAPEAVEQLPFKGAAAIVYFAQMQHLFAFAMDPKSGGAVMLRQSGFGGLDDRSTPTPKVINFLLRHIGPEDIHDIGQVERAIPTELAEEIREFYGSMRKCLEAHGPVFYLEETVVMRTNLKRKKYISELPMEEQLQLAYQARDKHKIKVLRRRIMMRDNPSHPFLDPDNFAPELARHLPRKGFVTLKQFLTRIVPEELLFFMPRKTQPFFLRYPQYFTFFEFQYPGQWALSRPEIPLPRGVIRKDFSEEDVVRLVAQFLQQKGPRACGAVLSNLPKGASDYVKKQHGSVYHFAIKYPDYFNVIVGSETESAIYTAMLHLLKLPGVELSEKQTNSQKESAAP